jgi:hypothetical protein
MRNNKIVLVVALALSASLFTRGFGEEGPVPISCHILESYSCIGFQAPSMPWPGGPLETPLDCSQIPPFVGSKPCTSDLDCQNLHSAYHNVSQSDWETLRSTDHTPSDPPGYYEFFGWGWWGLYVTPAQPFVCQWKTSCTTCVYRELIIGRHCGASPAVPSRSMPQYSGGGASPCFVPGIF